MFDSNKSIVPHQNETASVISELATEFEVYSSQLLQRNLLSIFNCPAYYTNDGASNYILSDDYIRYHVGEICGYNCSGEIDILAHVDVSQIVLKDVPPSPIFIPCKGEYKDTVSSILSVTNGNKMIIENEPRETDMYAIIECTTGVNIKKKILQLETQLTYFILEKILEKYPIEKKRKKEKKVKGEIPPFVHIYEQQSISYLENLICFAGLSLSLTIDEFLIKFQKVFAKDVQRTCPLISWLLEHSRLYYLMSNGTGARLAELSEQVSQQNAQLTQLSYQVAQLSQQQQSSKESRRTHNGLNFPKKKRVKININPT